MRLTLLAAGLLAMAAFAGCKPVPKEQATKAFHKEVHLYFNNLNNDAQFRKDEFRKQDVKLGLLTPTGSIYSTFTFDENAFIVRNYKCKTCETTLLITSAGTEYLCPSCGHCAYVTHPAGFNRRDAGCKLCLGQDGKPKEPNADLVAKDAFERSGAQVQPMFEFVQDNPAKPLIARIRYVRRQWAYDARGVVDVPQRAIDRAVVDASYIPTDNPQGGKAPGFHRADATFVGEIEFEYRGGELTVKTRYAEEPVRPWKDLKGNQ